MCAIIWLLHPVKLGANLQQVITKTRYAFVSVVTRGLAMYFLQVNLVDWLKVMVGSRQIDGVCDPRMEVKPSLRALKRVLLVSLRCVDPDAEKRPKLSHVIQMLETEDNPFHEVKTSYDHWS